VTYTVAAAVGLVAALALDVLVLRTRLVTRPVFWLTYPIVACGQLISNGFLTGLHVVRYSPDAILGLRIAYAPVEDLAFGFALILTTLSVWVWLGRHGVDRRPLAGERSVSEHARSGATGRPRQGGGMHHAAGQPRDV
jgi:lycopene cyclase domain-containing protein